MPLTRALDLARAKTVPNLAALVDLIGAQDLPIIVCEDHHYDATTVDFTEAETVTMTQQDEHGVVHTLILSAKIIDQIAPYMLLWKSKNLPPPPQLSLVATS